MKIKFTPLSEETFVFGVKPVPASKTIPDWYKKTDPYINNEKKVRILNDDLTAVNSTMKGCMPLYDSLTSGYMVTLSSDILVEKINGSLSMKWRTEDVLVHSTGINNSADRLPRNGMEYEIGKWIFDWKIETPPGYSCIFTHPFNRMDLPFRTMTGIVDTDKYPAAIHFPFQLNKVVEENFIIEEGTPICQIFPFKRDSWKIEYGKYDKLETKRSSMEVLKKISKSYKRQFWSKKKFL